jgi:hypothetical protein
MRRFGVPLVLLLALSAGTARAYGPVPEGLVSVYFGGPVPLPSGETLAFALACVSNETAASRYPGDVRFEVYRSEAGVADPNLLLNLHNETLDAPGRAADAFFQITNGTGTVNLFHVRILADKRIARRLLCNAHLADSQSSWTNTSSLPLVRSRKLSLPKDVPAP